MNSFSQTLEKYGADSAALHFLDEDGPELLPYATLVNARRSVNSELLSLTAVYEWQDRPLVYLIDGDQLAGNAEALGQIRRLVAMRGDAPYLGVVSPGRLTLYRVGLDKTRADQSLIKLDTSPGQEGVTFAYLGNQRPGLPNQQRLISDVVLRLLSGSINKLKQDFGIEGNDAISLVGRALFTRFLGDRDLLPLEMISDSVTEIEQLFCNASIAEITSAWLDRTFNGDFLPLSEKIYRTMPQGAFAVLSDILYRAPGGQFFLGWKEKWDNLHFAHIPVGVLSQAYEQYLKKHAPQKQKDEGGYYTPRSIAALLVKGSFHALRRDRLVHKARVLDPAAGAGVFLLTSFRQLVAERWCHDKARPETKTLREILYDQITGFDINEAALRFAALGLYLMSIELDPNPEPVAKLGFRNLRGKVLYKFGTDVGAMASKSLGSLGTEVGSEHIARYDLVVGNPPWSSATALPGWGHVKQTVVRIAQSRSGDSSIDPPLPNDVLDLPFVWRAMEWAKPNAQIAFALHARLLFQQAEGMPAARRELFRALDVTGIVNGTELRQTKVWPEIAAPFCLLFARNAKPSPGSGFRFLSPHLEKALNSSGNMRIDAGNAPTVLAEQAQNRPEILKILFRGTSLDLEIYDRLLGRDLQTLQEFWQSRFGGSGKHLRFAGNGYQLVRESTIEPKSAEHLQGKPHLGSDGTFPLRIDTDALPPFDIPYLHRSRASEIYQPPLLIVHKSPPAGASRIRVSVADKEVVFSETYYGYSARNHADGIRLVKYLALVLSSKLALWYNLITSGEFGFEREVVEKFIIDRIALPSYDSLQKSDLEKLVRLFDSLVDNDTEENWAEADTWVASLFGLRVRDLEVISDTLRFNLPFAENKIAAQESPTEAEVEMFCDSLKFEIRGLSEHFSVKADTSPFDMPRYSPWRFIVLRLGDTETVSEFPQKLPSLLRVADRLAASEIIHANEEDRSIWIGRLNQARYWSSTQARLVARKIIWDHVDIFTKAQVA